MSRHAADFWSCVDRRESTACWNWTRSTFAQGYGCCTSSPTYPSRKAHRVSWMIAHGPIPIGMQVLHRCDNRKCVNPAHLFIGTNADNVRDRVAKGRSLKRMPDHMRGETHPFAKIKEKQIPKIRAMLKAGEPCASIAERFGVTEMAISNIKHGKTWKHVVAVGREA